MDEEEFSYDRPRERAQSMARMSKVPSWISVGFVFGAMVAWYLKPEPKLPPPVVAPVPAVAARPQETKLTTIEAVFAEWGHDAVWDNDRTEFAYWNPGTKEFSEFYEVRRVGAGLFFRSLDRLTRRVINHGKEPLPECPLLFTETDEQYREWRDHGRQERPIAPSLRPVSAAVAVPPPPSESPPATVQPDLSPRKE